MYGNVKVYFQSPSAAKGPVHSRYYAAQLYGGQRYFMMIDSHIKFVPEWDATLIRMHTELCARGEAGAGSDDEHEEFELGSFANPEAPEVKREKRRLLSAQHAGLRRVVISVHPPPWVRSRRHLHSLGGEVDADDDDAHYGERHLVDASDVQQLASGERMYYLCEARFDYPELGYPVLQSREVNVSVAPMLQPYVAAGFLFTDGSVVESVPFDPHLPYIFHGEEILLSARLWTSGYDFYAPNVNMLYHYYYRPGAKKFWNDTDFPLPEEHWGEQEASTKRIQLLLETYDYVMPSLRRGRRLRRMVPDEAPADEPLVVRQDLALYGLGPTRTLQAYWEFAGLDMYERTVNRSKWPCGTYPASL
jgi:UDP-GlcNAc:polypeptide alpha-N-acetylglucosaminyltransferase